MFTVKTAFTLLQFTPKSLKLNVDKVSIACR